MQIPVFQSNTHISRTLDLLVVASDLYKVGAEDLYYERHN